MAEDGLTTKKAGKEEVNIHSMLVNTLDSEQDAVSEIAVRHTLKKNIQISTSAYQRSKK